MTVSQCNLKVSSYLSSVLNSHNNQAAIFVYSEIRRQYFDNTSARCVLYKKEVRGIDIKRHKRVVKWGVKEAEDEGVWIGMCGGMHHTKAADNVLASCPSWYPLLQKLAIINITFLWIAGQLIELLAKMK